MVSLEMLSAKKITVFFSRFFFLCLYVVVIELLPFFLQLNQKKYISFFPNFETARRQKKGFRSV